MKLYLYALLFIFMISNLSNAQTNEKLPLSEYLEHLNTKYKVSFSLDADLIQGITISSSDTSSTNVDQALNQLAENVPFQFQKVDSENILVLPIQASDTELHFKIIDDEQNPIPGIYVRVKDKPISTVSNIDGQIVLKGKTTPYDSVSLEGIGFDKRTIKITDLNAKTPIVLNYTVNHLQEIIVENYIVSGINSIVNDHSLQIDQNDISIIPGQAAGDVLQSISILPGINSPNTKAGNLYIRGSTTDQTLIYFDNIPLYNKGHFFGTISPFNQLVVDKVNVYRSGSHPRLGGRAGGTIEIKTSTEISDTRKTSLGISLSDVLFYTKIPIVKNKLDFMISARHSLPSSLNTPRQESIINFINQDSPFESRYKENPEDTEIIENKHEYKDINGKLIFKQGSSKIMSSFLYTNSFRNREYKDVSENTRSIDYLGGENIGFNVQWSKAWNKSLSTNISTSISNYNNLTNNQENDTINTPLVSKKYFNTNISDIGIKIESRYYDKKDINYIDFGYNLDIQENSIDGIDITPRGEVKIGSEQAAKTHSLFGHYNIRKWKKLSLNIGSRISYYSLTKQVYLEPRIFYNYQINKPLSIKGSFSVSNQYLKQLIFFDFNDSKPENFNWGLSSKDHPPVHSVQKTIGFLYNKNSWIFDVEAYYKKLTNITISGGQAPNGGGLRLYDGIAKMKGIDILIRKKINKVSLWTSYSLCETTWHFDSISTKDFHAYYDQRHQINVGSNLKKKKFSVSTNFKITSGLPIQEVVGLRPAQSGAPNLPKSLEVNGRTPWQHQLDISASYLIKPTNTWNMLLSLSLYNIYNNKTLLETQTERTYTYNVYTLGFSPNLQLVVNF